MRLIGKIQIRIPFTMLYESYLDYFIKHKFNPEIYFSSDALDKYAVSDFNYIADQLHKMGLNITLHAPFTDLSPGSPDAAIRAVTKHRFEQMLKIVSIFMPKTVVCHTGYDWKRYWPIKDIWMENSIDTWTWFGEKILSNGAHLTIENVYEYYPDDMLTLLDKLKNQNVGFCLDIGHQAVFSLSSLEKWIEVLGTHLKQLHLHDNFGERDDHLALGKGNINFPKLFKFIKALDNKPLAITIEPHKEQDVLPSLEYLEKVWPWRF